MVNKIEKIYLFWWRKFWRESLKFSIFYNTKEFEHLQNILIVILYDSIDSLYFDIQLSTGRIIFWKSRFFYIYSINATSVKAWLLQIFYKSLFSLLYLKPYAINNIACTCKLSHLKHFALSSHSPRIYRPCTRIHSYTCANVQQLP